MTTAEADPPRPPLGHVLFGAGEDDPDVILAELLGQDSWRVTIRGIDQPGLARAYADYYRDAYRGPSDGFYGSRILKDLARRTDGVGYFHAPPPVVPELVY